MININQCFFPAYRYRWLFVNADAFVVCNAVDPKFGQPHSNIK